MQAGPLKNVFNSTRVETPKKSVFDLSHDVKISLKMGYLVPCNIQEILPGDRITISSEAMLRMMPMVAPPVHKINVYFHHFFVPNRLTWPNWETFITGGSAAEVNLPPVVPRINCTGAPLTVTASSLANYLGLPVTTIDEGYINALPFAAYSRIWYDYYRDQNLQLPGDDPGELPDGDLTAPYITDLTTLHRRAWEHDYFTSCLPFAQKGAAMEMPMDIAGKVQVYYDPTYAATPFLRWASGSGTGAAQPMQVVASSPGSTVGEMQDNAGAALDYDPGNTLYADFDNNALYGPVTLNGTINDLRMAYALQRWLEVNAAAGSRYIEHLLVHFGVRSSDYRLQRAQYLGGSKSTMAISEVLQTSESAATPQGTMAGHGISLNGGNRCEHTFEEHGYFITILSIMPSTAYYQGIPKFFRKTVDRFQYAFPLLAQVGEQPVKNEELVFISGQDNDGTFGYLPIYSEYRFTNSKVLGQMATTLEFWHMGRKFSTAGSSIPLNDDFIVCDPTKRIFAVTDPDEDEIVGQIYHDIRAYRPLPYYGSPGGLG